MPIIVFLHRPGREILSSARAALCRFAGARRGAAAVEFALISVPTVLTVCAIFAFSLNYYGQVALEQATLNAGRNLQTGVTELAGYSASQVQAQVCAQLPSGFNCGNLFVSVSALTSPAYVSSLASPYQSPYYGFVNSAKSGLIPISTTTSNDSFATSTATGSCWLIVIQTAYAAPISFAFLSNANSATFGGQKVNMLTSSTTFLTEPFPTSATAAQAGC